MSGGDRLRQCDEAVSDVGRECGRPSATRRVDLTAPFRVAGHVERSERCIRRTLPTATRRARTGARVAHQVAEVSIDPASRRVEGRDGKLRHQLIVPAVGKRRHSCAC